MRIVMDALRAHSYAYAGLELDQIALAIYSEAVSRATPDMIALLETRPAVRDRSRPYVMDDSDFEYALQRDRYTLDQLGVMMVLAGTRRREEAVHRAAQRARGVDRSA